MNRVVLLLGITVLTILLQSCASLRLRDYYEEDPVSERETTELDFKSAEELDQIGKQIGPQ